MRGAAFAGAAVDLRKTRPEIEAVRDAKIPVKVQESADLEGLKRTRMWKKRILRRISRVDPTYGFEIMEEYR